ncbi:hypothetical protein M0805_001881 [Coniferiporia weirii]|nr:hypothetical protein M0805_001881 [Coniferiporia weirii]
MAGVITTSNAAGASSPTSSSATISGTESGPRLTTSTSSSLSPPFPPAPASASGPNGGGGIPSSSASNLYLYTFLATLVLLLFVSGAVILRSITLRLRARREIEEAIRNGTYVPPSTSFRGNANATKPTLYDAHLKYSGLESQRYEKGEHWSTLLPVAASFVSSPRPRIVGPPLEKQTESINLTALGRFRRRFGNLLRSVHLRDILEELDVRDFHTRIMQSQSQPRAPTQAELAAVAFTSPSERNAGTAERAEIEPPHAMRVALLIAMPDPSHPTYTGQAPDTYADRPSTSSSSASDGDGKGKSPVVRTPDTDAPAEVELPYVEFGITEVALALPRGTGSESAVGRPDNLSMPAATSADGGDVVAHHS